MERARGGPAAAEVPLIEIPADLPPELVPLAFLLGRWTGSGVGGYPTLPGDFAYRQELIVEAVPGRPVLAHRSRTWDEATGAPLAGEVGWWRPGDGLRDVELLLAHPTGVVEVYLGEVDGARVELRTDLVARTATAKEVTAAHRLYGLVEGDLLYRVDLAAMGHGLAPHTSARLQRTEG